VRNAYFIYIVYVNANVFTLTVVCMEWKTLGMINNEKFHTPLLCRMQLRAVPRNR